MFRPGGAFMGDAPLAAVKSGNEDYKFCRIVPFLNP